MQRFWCGIILLIFGIFQHGFAQVMPLESLSRETRILVFVRGSCKACIDLKNAFQSTRVTFVGVEASLPFDNYLQDHQTKLLHRTFRVYADSDFPAIFVLQNGQSIYSQKEMINRKAVLAAYRSAKQKTFPYSFKIRIGQKLEGEFANHSGLITFWRAGCENCRMEQPQLEAACQKKSIPILVLYTRSEGTIGSCEARYGREYAMQWGSPGVPSFVYLVRGVVRWLDVGYRNDLEQLIEALRVTGGSL